MEDGMEKKGQAATSAHRFEALDGMRGIAALIVFAHHALVLLFGPLAGINPNKWQPRPQIAVRLMHHAPVAWIFNGAFAVSFFFVLSGFVLTRAVGSEPKATKIAQNIAHRFFRLFPMVAVGSCVGFVAFYSAKLHLDELLNLTGNDSSSYLAPSLVRGHGYAELFQQVLVKIWRGARAEELYDPPLWSIGMELKGSLLIYFLALPFAATRRAYLKYGFGALCGLCLIGTDAVSFLAGMALAERSFLRQKRGGLSAFFSCSPVWLWGCSLLTLIWASVHPWDRTLWLPLPFSVPALLDTLISTAGASALMVAGLQIPLLLRALCTRPIQWLGGLSYGFYVIHVPILYLLCAPLLNFAHRHIASRFNAGFVVLSCFVVSCVVGEFLVKCVDNPLSKKTKDGVRKWLT